MRNSKIVSLAFLLCAMLLNSACGPSAEKLVTQTATAATAIAAAWTNMPTVIATATATATGTATPTPTNTYTPLPTMTPRPTRTPTPTPTPIPTKQVLIQYGAGGGDGGYNTDFYFGRETPDWVLYAEGELLFRNSHYRTDGNWFLRTVLTPAQICSLLSSIEGTGLFSVKADGTLGERDPIYIQASNSTCNTFGPSYFIQINGKLRKYVSIHVTCEPYLMPEIQAAFQLIRNYAPSQQMTPYRARYLLLWIENGRGQATGYATPQPTSQVWPIELPSIRSMLGDRTEGEAFIDGKFVQPILDVFLNRPAGIVFRENNQDYWIIARPLLPHETQDMFSAYPSNTAEFALPFKCGN